MKWYTQSLELPARYDQQYYSFLITDFILDFKLGEYFRPWLFKFLISEV